MTRTAEESGADSGAAGQAKGSGAASPDASSGTISGGHLVAKALDLDYRTVGRNPDIVTFSGRGGPAEVARPLDGPGPAGHPRCRRPVNRTMYK